MSQDEAELRSYRAVRRQAMLRIIWRTVNPILFWLHFILWFAMVGNALNQWSKTGNTDYLPLTFLVMTPLFLLHAFVTYGGSWKTWWHKLQRMADDEASHKLKRKNDDLVESEKPKRTVLLTDDGELLDVEEYQTQEEIRAINAKSDRFK